MADKSKFDGGYLAMIAQVKEVWDEILAAPSGRHYDFILTAVVEDKFPVAIKAGKTRTHRPPR